MDKKQKGYGKSELALEINKRVITYFNTKLKEGTNNYNKFQNGDL